MTEQEIHEGNTLITEFVEYPGDGKGMYFDNLNQLVFPEDLPYHRDWNWLMTAIKKILNIVSELDDMERFWQITDQIPDIREVYRQVIYFIKWYNTKEK
jgi:hypothetical protein